MCDLSLGTDLRQIFRLQMIVIKVVLLLPLLTLGCHRAACRTHNGLERATDHRTIKQRGTRTMRSVLRCQCPTITGLIFIMPTGCGW